MQSNLSKAECVMLVTLLYYNIIINKGVSYTEINKTINM